MPSAIVVIVDSHRIKHKYVNGYKKGGRGYQEWASVEWEFF